MKITPELQRRELAEQRRKVDFDTYDVTVDELIRRVAKSRIDIAPVYQRQFRWDEDRQSRLIESFLLGIPVPPLFMATNQESGSQTQWEVVDGLQRLLTLVGFAGECKTRIQVGLEEEPLVLRSLEKLSSFSGFAFADLPTDIRTALEDRPVKVVVLNDKSDLQVRFDLFERLNTGGVALTPHEVRECVYRGPFLDLVASLSASDEFHTVVHLPSKRWKDGTPQDYVLRFFAFLERYREFKHSVRGFLNDFTQLASDNPSIDRREAVFKSTFRYLARAFPEGVRSRRGTTAVNLFEAVSVGAALALRTNPACEAPTNTEWVSCDALRKLTTGATNSRSRVVGRIEFCRDAFLGSHV